MGSLWIGVAELETQSFSFRAYGATPADARRALFQGLKIHATQHGLPDSWAGVWIESANAFEARLGDSYRDYATLTTGQGGRQGA